MTRPHTYHSSTSQCISPSSWLYECSQSHKCSECHLWLLSAVDSRWSCTCRPVDSLSPSHACMHTLPIRVSPSLPRFTWPLGLASLCEMPATAEVYTLIVKISTSWFTSELLANVRTVPGAYILPTLVRSKIQPRQERHLCRFMIRDCGKILWSLE